MIATKKFTKPQSTIKYTEEIMTKHPTWYECKLQASDGNIVVAFGASYPDAQQKAQIALAQYEQSIL